MKPLIIKGKKGDTFSHDEITMVEKAIMDASLQDGKDPEDMDFLTLKENIVITVRNWRQRKS